MDPLTQGALGAAAAASFRRTKPKAAVIVTGWLGGMAADVDVVLRSESDPILFLEYHRQFTHSLLFIPVGGLIVALFLWMLTRRRGNLMEFYRDATIGYATHGLLDACTSYGTQLYWPFTNFRAAWNLIAIIDPVFTLTLLAGIVAAMTWKRERWVRLGLALALTYLAFGYVMNHWAESAAHRLAESRGHTPVRLTAKPSMANIVLWRSIYEFDGTFFIDAIRVSPFREAKVYPGTSVPKVAAPPPEWPAGTTLAKDFERFRWFSDDYLAWHPEVPGLLGDARYSTVPNRAAPLWGIRANAAGANAHADYIVARTIKDGDWSEFWSMIRGL